MKPKFLFFIFVNTVLILFIGSGFFALNQQLNQWSSPQTIPDYHPDTWSPILIPDRNRTVHAFTYQWLGEDQSDSRRAILYNNWSPETGWTEPVDILLSPLKNDARLTSALLDQNGLMHVVFWGGDNTDARFYYSKAPASEAGKARAWSYPYMIAANAADPPNSVFFAVDSNNLGILFSGRQDGNGIYATYSQDNGDSWSSPELVIQSKDRLIRDLQIFQSQSGQINLIWNEITLGAQGRGIYYSSLNKENFKWKDPIKLAEAESGLGTQTPAIIEKNGEIFAFFNLGGKILMRRSRDGGEIWSNPVPLFLQHVGVNGSLSPVIDSKNVLHLFFGQRITGFPDIHGIWHSVWQGDHWTEPEAIVSGPQVTDLEGDTAFDPYEARAVVSQGNVVLVTWRSDPGNKGNGIWYAYEFLDAPELPIATLPSQSILSNIQTALPLVFPTSLPLSTPEPSLTARADGLVTASQTSPLNQLSMNTQLLIGILPVTILIAVAWIYLSYQRSRR